MTVLIGVAAWVLVNRTGFGVLSSLAGRNPMMIVWQGGKLNRLGLAGFVLERGAGRPCRHDRGASGPMAGWSAASCRPTASPRS